MSHEEQTDLRIQRTHKFLQEVMIALITEKGFDAITVGDIALFSQICLDSMVQGHDAT